MRRCGMFENQRLKRGVDWDWVWAVASLGLLLAIQVLIVVAMFIKI